MSENNLAMRVTMSYDHDKLGIQVHAGHPVWREGAARRGWCGRLNRRGVASLGRCVLVVAMTELRIHRIALLNLFGTNNST